MPLVLRPRRDYRCRTYDLALTAKDVAIFSEALRVEFPHVGFVSIYGAFAFKPNLVEFERQCRIVLPPDGEWWSEVESHPWIVNLLSLYHCARRYISVDFHRSWWQWSAGHGNHDWAWDPPTLDAGFLAASYLKDDPDHVRRTVDRVWKVAERVTARCLVSAVCSEEPLPPGPRPRVLPETYPQPRAGFDAAAWCQGAPRRMINGYARPSRHWVQPRSDWYEETAARMEKVYGELFTNPESVPRAREG